jgi:hypothetical protein
MSRHLINSIISKNMLEANDVLEAKLNEIRERKLFEMKRMYQAEAFGGLTKAEIEARKKAGYKKASDVLGDPRAKKHGEKRLNPQAKIIKKKIAEDTLDEEGLGFGAQAAHGMTSQQKSQFKSAMNVRRLAKKSTNDDKGKSTNSKDPYEGKGNLPLTMLGRAIHKGKKAVSDYKPGRPGETNLKVAKGVAKGVGSAVGAVAKELGSIGFSNLE